MKTRKIVALLPMKANSERVEGKNFRQLAGKPLFRWILDSLLAVPVIEKVVGVRVGQVPESTMILVGLLPSEVNTPFG